MAPSTRDAALATAVVATVGAAAAGLYLYREQTQEVARSTYAAVSAQASVAATKGAEVAKALQASAVAGCSSVATSAKAGCSSVATSANSAWESVAAALKKAKSQRSLRRVRSFPVIVEDDVAAGSDKKKDQKEKKKSKSPSKKKAVEQGQMGVNVQVTAK